MIWFLQIFLGTSISHFQMKPSASKSPNSLQKNISNMKKDTSIPPSLTIHHTQIAFPPSSFKRKRYARKSILKPNVELKIPQEHYLLQTNQLPFSTTPSSSTPFDVNPTTIPTSRFHQNPILQSHPCSQLNLQ